MADTPVTLDALTPGVQVNGLLPGQTVAIISVTKHSPTLAEVIYRDAAGTLGEIQLHEGQLATISIATQAEAGPPFTADPVEFKLASEALRIKYAALYDPMAAVNSSDVDPLPHQIRAVYEELLPRIPLRFLLADDPGAGKTIMAGLYLKELILRSDCERAIIVAPGGLVEQWREELASKFNLTFELFTPQMVDEAQGKNPFTDHPYVIARMDQLSRNSDLMEHLRDTTWDVAIVDEAHKMSAQYKSWTGEFESTKRFKLGQVLSATAHHFLLMTATPHNGIEEQFQLFLTLLDHDRFEGKYDERTHRQANTKGLMRRMVKEDLLTFEGKPLFPERKATTIPYDLSPREQHLYDEVTDYVRTQMGRADAMIKGGDAKRGNAVGFALTVLQRRLASSPQAILRSLERRVARLNTTLLEVQALTNQGSTEADQALRRSLRRDQQQLPINAVVSAADMISADEIEAYYAEDAPDAYETEVNEVINMATAAQTVEELKKEIITLEELVRLAREVHAHDTDTKWVELRSILDDQVLTPHEAGAPRKLIVFTEHRDTLDYLHTKIVSLFGKSEAVLTIHGQTNKDERKRIREEFTHNREVRILLATDAAGEGLNLQRAHLMVNYDLPWNPNRIEQRFGRIHRIGQKEVCHLWNLVAKHTREGEVFLRLLKKIDEIEKAYEGNLFHVLGETKAFDGKPLRQLIMDAIRYGNEPETKSKIDEVIDASVANGLSELTRERALHGEMFSTLDMETIKARMEQARERKLQPGFIQAFMMPAFARLGGQMHPREQGRFEITRVPQAICDQARRTNRWAPVAERYERVTFEPKHIQCPGTPEASLIAPGHPLLDAIIAITINDLGHTLREGAVFIDHRATQDPQPAIFYTVDQRIVNAAGHTVSRHFDYPARYPDGTVTLESMAPFADFDAPTEAEAPGVAQILADDWTKENHESPIKSKAFEEGMQPRFAEVLARTRDEVANTRTQVKQRLRAERNFWDAKAVELAEAERRGEFGKIRAETATKRADDLDERLHDRLLALEAADELIARPAVVRGTALVIPSLLVAPPDEAAEAGRYARATQVVERRAVDRVIAEERRLGRRPVEQARNNKGYDIASTDAAGRVYFIEVKGRIEGADTFSITSSEVTLARTHPDRHRLALVKVSPDGPEHDEVRYVRNAFAHHAIATTTSSYTEKWDAHWQAGGPPV